MLSKSATMLLGLINQRPLNPYEIIKQLQIMNVHRWYNIANSTVYATLKALEKKEYILTQWYSSICNEGDNEVTIFIDNIVFEYLKLFVLNKKV